MIKNLQFLRAIASLLVVIFHNQFIPYKFGLFGVDLFFVISGFIVTNVIFKNSKKFFLKRLIRILPTYYIFTLIVIILYHFNFLEANLIVNFSSIIKSMLFIPYSFSNSGPILSNGWTLNYEMFFYLITSFSILLFKKPIQIVIFCICILILFCIAPYCIFNNSNYINYYLNYYSNPIIIEFLLGIIVFLIIQKSKLIIKNNIISIISKLTIFILFGLMIIMEIYQFQQYRLFFYGIPSSILVLCYILTENKFKQTKIYLFFVKLGDASYIMYLLHPLILKFIYLYIFIHYNIFFDTIFLIGSLLIISILSILLHNKIEKKIINYLNLRLC